MARKIFVFPPVESVAGAFSAWRGFGARRYHHFVQKIWRQIEFLKQRDCTCENGIKPISTHSAAWRDNGCVWRCIQRHEGKGNGLIDNETLLKKEFRFPGSSVKRSEWADRAMQSYRAALIRSWGAGNRSSFWKAISAWRLCFEAAVACKCIRLKYERQTKFVLSSGMRIRPLKMQFQEMFHNKTNKTPPFKVRRP